jgi:CheY-like chemotaxis protein
MKKVLIVEDNQLVAHLYGNRFTLEGFQVKIAPDGQAALALVHSFRPDAVILDLMLPKMTGVELMKKIRAEPRLEPLAVIVLSDAYLTGMMQQAWKAGATNCLSKEHSTPKQVVEAVRRALVPKEPPVPAPLPSVDAPVPTPEPLAAVRPTPGADSAASDDSGVF